MAFIKFNHFFHKDGAESVNLGEFSSPLGNVDWFSVSQDKSRTSSISFSLKLSGFLRLIVGIIIEIILKKSGGENLIV